MVRGRRAAAASVWLVTWKKAAGKPILSYDDAVSEALAFGWVDSKGGKIDENRTMLYFARRKRGSVWSGLNKLRIEHMRAAGLVHEAGEAVIARAEADGSLTLLDDVERLIVPPDPARRRRARARTSGPGRAGRNRRPLPRINRLVRRADAPAERSAASVVPQMPVLWHPRLVAPA
jgi:hypothetical protein